MGIPLRICCKCQIWCCKPQLLNVEVERQPKRIILKSSILPRSLLPSKSHSKHHHSLNKQSAQGVGPPITEEEETFVQHMTRGVQCATRLATLQGCVGANHSSHITLVLPIQEPMQFGYNHRMIPIFNFIMFVKPKQCQHPQLPFRWRPPQGPKQLKYSQTQVLMYQLQARRL